MKEEKVSVTSGKKKASVCKETDAVSVTKNQDRAQKPDHNAATLSEPSLSRGRSASKKKTSIQGKSIHGAILRQPCRCYLKGICTRTSCEYWSPPECQFYKTEAGCKAGDKCLFPHHKVEEQQHKKPKKCHCSHKGRESDDKNAVAAVKIVPQLGCVSQDSDGYLKIGYQLRQKGEERRKYFNIASCLYIRAIQGHSGDNAVDLALQVNVLSPKGFTEYIYHVGNANKLNSIIRNGLIPGGKSL